MEENKPGLMIAGWLSRMTAGSDGVADGGEERWFDDGGWLAIEDESSK